MTTRRSAARGFTTSELLVAMGVSLTTLATVQSFLVAQQKALALRTAYADSQAATRTLIDLLGRELGMATFDPRGSALPRAAGPSCPGASQGLVEATPTRVRIQMDRDGNGRVNGAGEDVVYELAGSAVRRTEGRSAAVTIVEGVPKGGFAFTYFDASSPAVELAPSGKPPVLSAAQRDCVAKIRLTVSSKIQKPRNAGPTTPAFAVAATEFVVRGRALGNF